MKTKALRPLLMECSINDMNMLSVYVSNNVFTEEALLDAKADTSETIERLHKRRSILAAFAKLISFNCLPIKYAAEIFRGYIKYSAAYMDIIKHLLASCRDISKVNTARTICMALQREYIEISFGLLQQQQQQQNTVIDRSWPQFAQLKELVHRFCLSFGPEASVKSREAIIAIHSEAIRYACESQALNASLNSSQATSSAEMAAPESLAPPNIFFLECISEFSTRLNAADKRTVLAELDKTFAKRANKIETNNWNSYYAYRVSLMEDFHHHHQQQHFNSTKTTTTIATASTTIQKQQKQPANLTTTLHQKNTSAKDQSTIIIASSLSSSVKPQPVARPPSNRPGLRSTALPPLNTNNTLADNTNKVLKINHLKYLAFKKS